MVLPDVFRSSAPPHMAPELICLFNDAVEGRLKWPLTVVGEKGVGKTCFGLSMLDYSGGLYFTPDDLQDWITRARFGKLELADSWGQHYEATFTLAWEYLRNKNGHTPLVVLDELATRADVSDAHVDVVLRLLNERDYKPLVVLSNLQLQEEAGSDEASLVRVYGARMVDRLAAGTVIKVGGRSRRLPPLKWK